MSTTRPVKVRRRTSRLSGSCIALLILLCITASAVGYGLFRLDSEVVSVFGEPAQGINLLSRFYYQVRLISVADQFTSPAQVDAAESVFEIRQGETVGSVAYRLETAGLIRSADTFRIFLIYSGMDRSLQAGKYKIAPSATALEIAQQLQDATPAEVLFVILPGWRLEEIAASLPTSGLTINPDDFTAAARTVLSSQPIPGVPPESQSLEGFLFPGEYLLPREAGIDQVLAAAVTGFQTSVPPEVLSGFQAQDLNLYDAVILASIVQREAVVVDEQPMIASVFLNRLAAGMKLDSDPTVQYAIGYNPVQKTWWTNPLSADDLQIDSPYNTYLYPDLPPSPIANPGLSALRAVAFPAISPYYYFRARCDGTGRHSFAVSFDEHLNNACQ